MSHAVRRKLRRKEAQLAYEALTIEGGLLSPEWLARVGQQQAGGQAEADYRVPKGLSVRDEINRAWQIAQAHWQEFVAGRAVVEASGGDPRLLTERFVQGLLREAFGFASLQASAPVEVGGHRYPIGHAALSGQVPVVIAPAVSGGSGVDVLSAAFGEGGRRRSAFGLAQEYLNAAQEALWGLCSDGLSLRLLRDNQSLTRPAWVEADLVRLFEGGLFAEFSALWLLMHESRFGRPGQPPTACALETWRSAGREEGTRARDQLRGGVEEALRLLGDGFLQHAENGALRQAVQRGELKAAGYHQQLLRLVYRLLFLLTVEERGLLHPRAAPEAAQRLYQEGFSLRRLRERATRRSAIDRYSDLWEGVKVVFRGLAGGEPRLGLPALGGLFAAEQCAALDGCKLENRHLLLALFRLCWLREEAGLTRVNWRDMGPEELGSVYESLLELVPQFAEGGRKFGFASGGETRGNARKLTGSYYTPESLVQVLLDSALVPVMEAAQAAALGRGEESVEALLRLSVVDPACGSGHFLLAAGRRLAVAVARLRAGGTPSKDEYQAALRQVVGRCLYGVDLNPMAVELCKVSLWMEAVEPGRPLSFLDSHIQHGNALLGATPELLAKGVPDEAWEPIEGDDKKVASALKKRNKVAAGQQELDLGGARPAEQERVIQAVAELEAAGDGDLAAVGQKQQRWQGILESEAYRHQRFVADVWCAAFVWPKVPGELAEAAPVNGVWMRLAQGWAKPSAVQEKTVGDLAEKYRFFHWHLQFPTVFGQGGFDVVLGNPPWERVKIQEPEFFAARDEAIAKTANAALRKKLIAKLEQENFALWSEWRYTCRAAEGESQFLRKSGRFPLCGKGDVNTYALFAEQNWALLNSTGRAGFIVPPGLATDDTTKAYFQKLTTKAKLASLFEFENEEFLFPGIDHRVRFIAITVVGSDVGIAASDLSFGNRQVAMLADRSRHFSLSPADFSTLNPNTLTCPTFRSRRDADVNLAIYRRAGVAWREDSPAGNLWGLQFMRMLDMSNDSDLFKASSERVAGEQYLPLTEAKMVHHFDHRFGTYEGQSEGQANQGKLPELDAEAHADPYRLTLSNYWVREAEVRERLQGRWSRGWLLGWRDICRSTDQRTMIATLVPRAAVGNTIFLTMPSAAALLVAAFYANLCSFVLDYAARQKVGGTHLAYHVFKQLPVLPPLTYEAPAAWETAVLLKDWLLPRVLELTYTAWDLESFAQDVGYDGPPFRWDPDRRALLRAELDAAFFHLYGISRDDADFILSTFPIVRRNDEKAFGEFRTRRLILERYDALAQAARTDRRYHSPLDPPPASPRVAHPPQPAK